MKREILLEDEILVINSSKSPFASLIVCLGHFLKLKIQFLSLIFLQIPRRIPSFLMKEVGEEWLGSSIILCLESNRLNALPLNVAEVRL